MEKEYNSMSFDRENIKQGLHTDLINYLMNYHLNDDDRYNDIHITSDGECLIVEWVQIPYDHSYGGRFVYCDEDCCLMREVIMPDDSSAMIFVDEEDPNDVLRDWLINHPGWKRNDFGRWVYDESFINKN